MRLFFYAELHESVMPPPRFCPYLGPVLGTRHRARLLKDKHATMFTTVGIGTVFSYARLLSFCGVSDIQLDM